MTLSNYFLIGIIFTFIIDLCLNKYREQHILRYIDWGWGQRILCIITWPIGLGLFFYYYFKSKK
jgi:uncharacterized protein YybS (DUF2232 family)